MDDYSINYTEVIYDKYADEAYTDRLVSSFYEFLFEMKEDCMVPKPYTLLDDTTTIKRFWEVG